MKGRSFFNSEGEIKVLLSGKTLAPVILIVWSQGCWDAEDENITSHVTPSIVDLDLTQNPEFHSAGTSFLSWFSKILYFLRLWFFYLKLTSVCIFNRTWMDNSGYYRIHVTEYIWLWWFVSRFGIKHRLRLRKQ